MASWNLKPPFQQFMLQGFSDHNIWNLLIRGASVGGSTPMRSAMARFIASAVCGSPG